MPVAPVVILAQATEAPVVTAAPAAPAPAAPTAAEGATAPGVDPSEIPETREPPPPPPARWSLGVNPLAFLLGRFGGDAEYLAASHVALAANLHVDGSAVLTNTGTDTYWGFGGEAGVRLYTEASLFGFFVGGSLIGGYYSVDYYGHGFPLPDVGFAIDMGGKARVGRSGFVALGVGVQRTWTRSYPVEFPWIVGQVLGGEFNPRFLLTAGTTFR